MANYRDQVLPIAITLSSSLLTAEFLYSYVTYKHELLIAIFVLIYMLFASLRKHITRDVYPPRKDGRTVPRAVAITGFCTVSMSVCTIVITRLIFDMFIVFRVKIRMKWWYYIDLFAIIITFLFSFLSNK